MKKSFLILFAICCLLLTRNAHAATLYTKTANQDVFEGQTFTVAWYLDTENESINSVDLKINYNTSVLKAVEASTGNSLINLWIKPPTIDANAGSIRLTGGIPNGANGSNVPVFSSSFEAIKSGPAEIKVDDVSVVLANDGTGKAVKLKFAPISFVVQPKDFIPNQISSPTHPDQNHWYSNRDVLIKFNPKSGTEYSFNFSSNIELFPDDTADTAISEYSYTDLPDGVYYFKVNSKAGSGNWTEAGVYRVRIDSTPPQEFDPVIGSDPNVFGGVPFVSFSTVDKTSGISHYMVKVGLFGTFKNAESPYKIQRPIVGDELEIKAIDNAGNERLVTIPVRGFVSVRVFELIVLLFAALVLILGAWKIKNRKRNIEIQS